MNRLQKMALEEVEEILEKAAIFQLSEEYQEVLPPTEQEEHFEQLKSNINRARDLIDAVLESEKVRGT